MDYSGSKLKIFSKYISKHKVAFAIDMLLSLLVAIIDLAFPMVSRWTMQSLLPNGIYKTFFAVMTILLVAYLLKAYFQYLVTVIGHRMGTLVEADMRRDAFAHIEELSFSYFDKNRTGILLSRITNDLFEIVEDGVRIVPGVFRVDLGSFGIEFHPRFYARFGESIAFFAIPGDRGSFVVAAVMVGFSQGEFLRQMPLPR